MYIDIKTFNCRFQHLKRVTGRQSHSNPTDGGSITLLPKAAPLQRHLLPAN